MATTTTNIHKKHWVVPFLREVVAGFDPGASASRVAPHLQLAPGARLEAWLDEALQHRGLWSSQDAFERLTPPGDIDADDRGDWYFADTLRRQIELLLELRLLLGRGIDGVSDQLHVLRALAAHTDSLDEAETLFELSLDAWGDRDDPRRDKLTRAMGPALKTVGTALQRDALQSAEQPLLGMPFHQFLIWSDSRKLARVGALLFADDARIDRSALRPLLARARMERIHVIEAIIALLHADGHVSRVEHRLVDNVVELARLDAGEADMVRESVTSAMSIEALAKMLPDPVVRRFAFETMLVHSQLDGESRPDEEAFVDEVARVFEIDPAARLRFEASLLVHLDRHRDLVDAFSLFGLGGRLKARLSSRVERIVRTNLDRIVTELRETGELASLLVKRSQGPLEPDEERRVSEQLADICKTVPALAIFAVPGGSVLLPILIKLLPFDVLPSAFTEKEEAL